MYKNRFENRAGLGLLHCIGAKMLVSNLMESVGYFSVFFFFLWYFRSLKTDRLQQITKFRIIYSSATLKHSSNQKSFPCMCVCVNRFLFAICYSLWMMTLSDDGKSEKHKKRKRMLGFSKYSKDWLNHLYTCIFIFCRK